MIYDQLNPANNLASLKTTLLELLIASSQIIERTQVSQVNSSKDIVTSADIEVSKMIATTLLKEFPGATIETEELGQQKNSEIEHLYFACDDIDGTDNYFRGNGMLPYCTCICAFQGRDVTVHPFDERLFKDIIAGCCIEHLSGTIFYAEQGKGVQILKTNLKPKNIQQPEPNNSGNKSTRILTDLYAGNQTRLISLYESTWVKDFGSSAIHYCLAATGLFDGLVFETCKAHELGLAYIFAKEGNRWLSDFSLSTYDDKPYIFNGSYEVLMANNWDLAVKLSKMIQ